MLDNIEELIFPKDVLEKVLLIGDDRLFRLSQGSLEPVEQHPPAVDSEGPVLVPGDPSGKPILVLCRKLVNKTLRENKVSHEALQQVEVTLHQVGYREIELGAFFHWSFKF